MHTILQQCVLFHLDIARDCLRLDVIQGICNSAAMQNKKNAAITASAVL